MELKHLQALLGIADTGSFSAAAASIGTVQSNVSAHVARLEGELDVQLVDRASGRVTEEGELVVERARRVMNELEAMVADVTALRAEVVGTVRLGMIGTTGRWLVPQLFDLLRDRHPHIHLNVADGSSVQLEQQLASGQLDLAVVTFPLSGDEIMAAQLFDEDLVCGPATGHPLGNETSVHLDRLSELELLLPAPGTALRAEIDSAAVPARITLRPGHGARRRAPHRLTGLRRLRAGHPPCHRGARPPARPVPGVAGRRASPAGASGWPSAAGDCPRRPCGPSSTYSGVVVNDALAMPEGIHPT